MVSVQEFRERLRIDPVDEIVEDLILTAPAAHVTEAQRGVVSGRIAVAYGVDPLSPSVFITGSAQLGFSISAHKRYQPFGPDSDIDVAVICPDIFCQIWEELSDHGHRSISRMPWDSGRLGHYLVHGWLRPDHFPKDARLAKCDAWGDTFRSLSAGGQFKQRKISGALFYSLHHLIAYQRRAVRDCAASEEISE